MRRYLIWSFSFHLAIFTAGAILAPLRGLFGAYQPPVIVSVGLVDFAEPGRVRGGAAPSAPEAARDEPIAQRPDQSLEPEKLKEKEKPKEEPKKEPPKKTGDDKKKDTAASLALAQNDTGGVSGSLSEGGEGGDVWGVETGANVNPYHRAGFAAIRGNWRNPIVGGIPRKCVIMFRVKRSGEIMDVELEKTSGSDLFDRAALRAVQVTASWPSFPNHWTENEQIIHLEFEYRPN